MTPARRFTLALFAFLVVLFGARPAAAEVTLCLTVAAPPSDQEGFEKLVRSEIARHKTHRVVDAGCRSRLRVELFEAAGVRYLTAQIDGEVPARYAIRDAPDLTGRVEDAIRLALRNDPVSLADDPTRMDAFQRFGQAILLHGQTRFRMELFDTITRDARGPTTLPGIGFSLWRGSGNWQIATRLYGAFSLEAAGSTKAALEIVAGADGCLAYELFRKDFWTPYGAACAGVQFVEFAGRVHPDAPTPVRAHDVGFAPSIRLGLRLFRWHAFDVDVFAQTFVPLSNAKDVDGVLLPSGGLYMPSVMTGIAIGF